MDRRDFIKYSLASVGALALPATIDKAIASDGWRTLAEGQEVTFGTTNQVLEWNGSTWVATDQDTRPIVYFDKYIQLSSRTPIFWEDGDRFAMPARVGTSSANATYVFNSDDGVLAFEYADKTTMKNYRVCVVDRQTLVTI